MKNLYDTVYLTAEASKATVPPGTVGSILHIYESPRLAYEVEFVDSDGSTLAINTVEADEVESVVTLLTDPELRTAALKRMHQLVESSEEIARKLAKSHFDLSRERTAANAVLLERQLAELQIRQLVGTNLPLSERSAVIYRFPANHYGILAFLNEIKSNLQLIIPLEPATAYILNENRQLTLVKQ